MDQPSPSFRVVRAAADLAALGDAADGPVFVIEDNIGYTINFVAKLLARSLAACLAQHDITPAQWVILQFLWVGEGLTQTQLSRHVVIDDATMVRTLDRMERDGLVQRVRNPRDRRQHAIVLTEKSRALRDVLVPCAVATNDAALQPLSAEEQQQLFQLLRRVMAALAPAALE